MSKNQTMLEQMHLAEKKTVKKQQSVKSIAKTKKK